MTAPLESTARPAPAVEKSTLGLRGFYAVTFASGFAGLGYEMLWTRMLAVSLGHEAVAVLAVLAAFFVGLAFGAWTLSGRVHQSAYPNRWYGLLELVIGGWAILLIWLVPAFNAWVPIWLGPQPSGFHHWLVAFGATLVLLLPATTAMGATLPALERAFAQRFHASHGVAALYAANTFGAVAGTVLTTFLLARHLGHSGTLVLCAVVNFSCALVFLGHGEASNRSIAPLHASVGARRLLLVLFVTGLSGIGFEVLVVRVLSQVLENTVFTFAAVLSVYLFGTALGAAIYRRVAVSRTLSTELLLAATATTVLLGAATLWVADAFYVGLSDMLGAHTSSALGGEFTVAVFAFLLPSASMGALFSHLARQAIPLTGLGRAVGANTFGAAVAPLLTGVWLLPLVGAKSALLLLACVYVLLIPLVSTSHWRYGLLPALVACVMALSLPALRVVAVPADGRLLRYEDGVMAAVAVVEDQAGTRYLKVDNHFTMGSTSSTLADHRQTHLPLLMHPSPRDALFLGVGTGMSLNAAQYHPRLKTTAVELVPEVLSTLELFGTAPSQNQWPSAPQLVASDARRFVVATDVTYDVVVADLFHPSRDGASALYTREHFTAIRRVLSDDGLFMQWLPLFQMDLATLRVIVRTFLDSFPHVQLHVPHFSISQPIVGLVGSEQPLRYKATWLQQRVTDPLLQQQLVSLRLNSNLAFMGGYLADEHALRRFAGDVAANTDDHPIVSYLAPAFAYEQRQGHGERLLRLLAALGSERGSLLASRTMDRNGQSFADRLTRYWTARDAYLEAGVALATSAETVVPRRPEDALLDVVRLSADFNPAYLPLLRMAQATASRDPQAAASLLRRLMAAAPERPEARALLQQLSASGP